MSRGNFGGARDLHKHIWKLPIPEFNQTDGLHIKLSALGRIAEAEAFQRIDELGQRKLIAPKIDTMRDELQNNWQTALQPLKRKRRGPVRLSPTTEAIEEAVAALLNQ